MGHSELGAFAVATVIPTFNPGPYLAETLLSLERQTILPSEVIVVDDGSEPCVSLPSTTLPVRLIRIAHSGISAARNAGVRAATSPLIHICDHDDIIEPSFYERIVDRFCHPAVDVVHADCGFIDAGGSVLAGRLPGAPPPYGKSSDATMRTLLKGNPIASVAAVFRRRLFHDLEGFQPYDFGQDWAFWLQAARRRSPFNFVPEVLAWHRVHPGQQSSSARTNGALEESIRMLTTLPISGTQKWQRARTVADLRLEMIRGDDDLETTSSRQAMRALSLRPLGAARALLARTR